MFRPFRRQGRAFATKDFRSGREAPVLARLWVVPPFQSRYRASVRGTPEWQKERVRAYYDATTYSSYLPNWAKESLGFHFGLGDDATRSNEEALTNTNRFLAEWAAIGPDDRVLDAGCGVGGSSLWLASSYGVRVVGITLLESQVQTARSLAAERDLHHLAQFDCMDMVATDFEDASFDVVWSIESMCYVVDLGAFTAEVARLLREGGRFACIDLCRGDVPDTGLEEQVCSGWAMAPMRHPREIVQALQASGLESVERVDLTEQAMRSAQALKAMATNRLFVLRAEKAFMKKTSSALEAHAQAAVAMVNGLETGATSVAHFLARR
jgi:tocopherol O-methyltransferase